MAGRGHNGHAYRKIWHALIHGPDFLVCALCHQPIDRSIRGRTSAAPSLDMIVPYVQGGDPRDPGNYRATHYGCNSRRGAYQRRTTRHTHQHRPTTPMVRQWTTVDQP